MNDWYIAHSAKGSTWAKHKYIRKDGNRYVYKDQHSSWNRKIGIHDRKAFGYANRADKLENDPNRANTVHSEFGGWAQDPGWKKTVKKAIANWDVADEYRRQRDELKAEREAHPKAAFAELTIANLKLSADDKINKGKKKAKSILNKLFKK